jgi:hypothetical protein
MQPLAAGPRANVTAAAVTALIRDSFALQVSAGLELLDRDLSVLADLTDLFAAGSVTRSSYADLHGSASLEVEGALDWGSAIVRPYMVLSSTTTTARFNLGAYYTPTPKTVFGRTPLTYAVEAIDILDGLATPVGDTYAVAAGTGYLAAVEAILLQQGFTAYIIDQTAAASVLPSSRTWVLDENTTWLGIINDLLGSIGYYGIWSDWDGRLRVQQYVTPSTRQPEWTYDTGALTSMLSPERTLEQDMYRAPNRWVFWRSNGVDGPAPTEGDGKYTVVNSTDGPTSVEARGGRVITRPKPLDVADQPSLVRAGQQIVDNDMTVKRQLTLGVAPNPLHWHFDVVALNDPDLASPGSTILVTKWTLPLDGGDGAQEWSVL